MAAELQCHPGERRNPSPLAFESEARPLPRAETRLLALWVPAFAGTTHSPAKILRQHQNLPRARHAGPAAVELGDQRLQRVAAGGALKRGLVGKFIHRQVQRGIAGAPEPPRLLHAERLYRIRDMFLLIP